MAKDILMPLLSPSMTEGTLVKWLKKEGDPVKSGDVLAEVETDKATMDLEAFDSGILRKILIAEGAKVPVQSRIGIIGTKDEKIDESTPAAPAAPTDASKEALAPAAKEVAKAPAPAAGTKQAPVPAPTPTGGRIKASPLAKKIAAEKGVALATLRGTGPGGRIVKNDVLNAPANGYASGGRPSIYASGPIAKEGSTKLTTMRSIIAKRLLESKTTIPHFYLEIEVDAKPLLDLRAQLNDSLGKLNPPVKLSLNDFVLKAAAEAVRRVPAVNASFEGDADPPIRRRPALLRGRHRGRTHHSDHQGSAEQIAHPDQRRSQGPRGQGQGRQAQARGIPGRHLHRLQSRHARHR